MRVLVTGANGFVGSWLVPQLAAAEHEVVAAIHVPDGDEEAARKRVRDAVEVVHLDLGDPASVDAAASHDVEAVVHLAAAAATGDAMADPGRAWAVNVVGTVRLAEAFGRRAARGARVRFLHVSSGAVYGGAGTHPRLESDPAVPSSSYAASKLASEVAVLEVSRRTKLGVVIARPFGHTGARQDTRFVVPAFARRILEAKRIGAVAVGVGNLEPIREFTHVSDVVEAYARLLDRGRVGEIYNVASGKGISMRDLFLSIADAIGYSVIPEVDADYVRVTDVPCLVGSAAKLVAETGWTPARSLRDTLAEVVDAQAD